MRNRQKLKKVLCVRRAFTAARRITTSTAASAPSTSTTCATPPCPLPSMLLLLPVPLLLLLLRLRPRPRLCICACSSGVPCCCRRTSSPSAARAAPSLSSPPSGIAPPQLEATLRTSAEATPSSARCIARPATTRSTTRRSYSAPTPALSSPHTRQKRPSSSTSRFPQRHLFVLHRSISSFPVPKLNLP